MPLLAFNTTGEPRALIDGVERTLTGDLYLITTAVPGLLSEARNVALTLLTVISIEATVVGMALALLPWAAAGEHTRWSFFRCLRWTWWCSSLALPVLIVLNIAALVTTYVHGLHFSYLFRSGDGPIAVPIFTVTTYLCAWWVFLVLFRGLLDYAGPAAGPGWEPRDPVCEGCGYRLAFLQPSGICPECAKPAAESLPGGDGGRPGHSAGGQYAPGGFVRLTLGLLVRQPLHTRRPRLEWTEARRFAVATLMLMLVPMHLTLPVLLTNYEGLADDWGEFVLVVMVMGAVFGSELLAFVSGAWVLTFFAGWWQDRRRDARVAATTAMYCTALFWPFVALVVVFFWSVFALPDIFIPSLFGRQPEFLGLTVRELILTGYGLVTLLLVFWWGLRTRAHLRSVRYTNW